MVIAVVNNKGGVGKTTTAVNLAAALAARAHKALLVDLDSQASASLWCGVARTRLQPSVADCLLRDVPVTKVIRPTRTPNLDLVTASADLANSDLALCDVVGRELTLQRTLGRVTPQYDFVVLDCPPSLSLVAVNALMAADALVVPVTPHYLAIEGLLNLLAAVDEVRERLRSRARILGILLTMVGEGRGPAAARQRVRTRYRDRVFDVEIASHRALEEAPGASQTIFEYAARSRAAEAFRRLATETLDRLRTLKR